MIGSDFHFSGSMADRTIDVSFYVTEPDFTTASSEALTTLRTALHAVGCITAGWPSYQTSSQTVRKLQNA